MNRSITVGARRLLAVAALVLPLLVSGVARADDSPPSPPANPPAPVASAEAGRPVGSYHPGPGDILRIEVYDDTSLSGDYTVTADRTLVFPLLGQVDLKGKTVADVADELTRRLGKDYLYDPKVDVSVKEFRSHPVKVLGNVGQPGIYYLDGPTRLFDLLSRAEGISPRLDDIRRGQYARISRGEGDSEKTIQVDLYDLLVEGKDESNITIEAGDVIYVPKSEEIHVVGEVKKPGSFPFESGMTVLKAITLAGGVTKKGTTRTAIIKRIVDGKEQKIKVKMEALLRPDDIVEVPLSFW